MPAPTAEGTPLTPTRTGSQVLRPRVNAAGRAFVPAYVPWNGRSWWPPGASVPAWTWTAEPRWVQPSPVNCWLLGTVKVRF